MRKYILLLLVFLGACNPSLPEEGDEREGVVTQVLSIDEWVEEASRCPAELAPAREVHDATQSSDCGPGKLKSCLVRCRAGTPGACYWLGQAIQGEGRNQQAAEVLYQRSCRLGIPSGCTNRAAGVSFEAKDRGAAQACAVRTYEKTCALDDPWGCTMYGLHLSQGLGTQINRDLAIQVLKKSCRYGPEDEACTSGTRLREQLLNSSQVAK